MGGLATLSKMKPFLVSNLFIHAAISSDTVEIMNEGQLGLF